LLGLSTKTVEGYRGQIMDKLGIRSLAGLVKYAIRMNLASVDD
jgi:DNA-binding NarL/FixJ family response regulator